MTLVLQQLVHMIYGIGYFSRSPKSCKFVSFNEAKTQHQVHRQRFKCDLLVSKDPYIWDAGMNTRCCAI